MKKTVILCLVLTMLCLCATGCGNFAEVASSLASSIQAEIENSIQEMATDFANQDFESVTIHVTTVDNDGQTLVSEYVVYDDQVVYMVEQFNNAVGGEGNIETLEGIAQIENGVLGNIVGDDVELPSYEELQSNFSFDMSNLENIKIEDGKVTADVISPDEFLGFETSITDMNIAIDMEGSSIQSVTMVCQTPDGTVTTVYTFQVAE